VIRGSDSVGRSPRLNHRLQLSAEAADERVPKDPAPYDPKVTHQGRHQRKGLNCVRATGEPYA
jgi:hypothetical protein